MRAYLVGVACVLFVFAAGMAGFAVAGSQPQPITVHVDGRAEKVVQRHPTVNDALRAARMKPADGALYSVVSHRRLDAHAFPARVFVDGKLARLRSAIAAGSRIVLIDGHDEVEPVESRDVASALAPGLPDVENVLWQIGQPGVDRVQLGEVSGEIVSRTPVQQPANAVPRGGMTVALTFDDGPDPRWTPAVLDILQQEGVKATFCEVGYLVNRFPDLTRLVAAQGHVLCDHTEHHMLRLDKRPHSQIVDEIQGGKDELRKATGKDPVLYRPPGGALSQEIIDVAHERGMRVLRWSIDPSDYRRPGASVIERRILDAVHPGAVILMHDGGGDRSQTVDQLRSLIDTLRGLGYTFTTPTDG
jgi:peptidoglycan/xylan/chitin deacetylase (PgdA/CDA1 family)